RVRDRRDDRIAGDGAALVARRAARQIVGLRVGDVDDRVVERKLPVRREDRAGDGRVSAAAACLLLALQALARMTGVAAGAEDLASVVVARSAGPVVEAAALR